MRAERLADSAHNGRATEVSIRVMSIPNHETMKHPLLVCRCRETVQSGRQKSTVPSAGLADGTGSLPKSFSTEWRSLRGDRPLNQLDAGAPGIGDVGDGAAGGALARRFVELDAFRLDLLHEGRVVLHVEADVVEHAPLGRGL